MSERVRVGVVDDHPLFRAGVVGALSRDPLIEIVGEGETASEAIRIAEFARPDVLLLDLGLTGDGLSVIERLATSGCGVKIVALTASERETDVCSALRFGAIGYVVKGTPAAELLGIVHRAAGGETYVTPSLAAKLFKRADALKSQASEGGPAALTHREDEILARVSIGKTNKEIARDCGVSEKTIKNSMTSIMDKLRVRNRVEAALLVKSRLQSDPGSRGSDPRAAPLDAGDPGGPVGWPAQSCRQGPLGRGQH